MVNKDRWRKTFRRQDQVSLRIRSTCSCFPEDDQRPLCEDASGKRRSNSLLRTEYEVLLIIDLSQACICFATVEIKVEKE